MPPKYYGNQKAVIVNYRPEKSFSIMESLCCGCSKTWGKMFAKKTHETELTPDEIDAGASLIKF